MKYARACISPFNTIISPTTKASDKKVCPGFMRQKAPVKTIRMPLIIVNIRIYRLLLYQL